MGQGWQGGSTYDLGAYLGDLDALEECLGRKPTKADRLAFEREVRARLNVTAAFAVALAVATQKRGAGP